MRLGLLMLAGTCVGALGLAACGGDTFGEPIFGGGSGGTASGGSGGSGGGGNTSSGSAGNGGSSTSSGSAGSGGGVAGEDCTNGLDDDGDSLVDCEDPSCTGAGAYQCLALPQGWQGPIYLPQAPGACPDGWPSALVDGAASYDGADPTCGCDCGAPSAACTGSAYLHLYAAPQCQQPSWMGGVQQGCSDAPSGGMSSALAVGNFTFGGSCPNAQGTVQSLPPVDSVGAATACGEPATGAGCGADACVPTPPGGAPLCVFQDGDVACPPGFPDATVLYTGYLDSRDCGCTCSVTGSCSGTIALHGQAGCGGMSQSLAVDGQCTTFSNMVSIIESADLVITPISTSACGADPGGGPTGTVTPTAPVTVCCRQP